MSIRVKNDSWFWKDSEGHYQTTAVFSEMLPTEVESIKNTAVAAVNSAGSTKVNEVNIAGTTQVGNVNTAGSTKVGEVNSAGTTQVGNVNSAGSAQVTAVENAGSTQVGLVNQAGSDQVDAVENAGDTQVDLVNQAGAIQITAINNILSQLQTDITQLKAALGTSVQLSIDWVIGGITSQGGLNSTFKYCIRPNGQASLISTNGSIGCDEGYQIRIVKYNNTNMGTGAFVSDSGWTSNSVAVFTNEYVAPQIRYANDTSTVLTDTSISEHIVYNLYENGLRADIINLQDRVTALENA